VVLREGIANLCDCDFRSVWRRCTRTPIDEEMKFSIILSIFMLYCILPFYYSRE